MSKQDQKKDIRLSPRKALKTRVVFEDEFQQGWLYFISRDISTSGIFIETELPFRAGTRTFISFALDINDKPIQTTAEVIRFQGRKRGPGRQAKNPAPSGIALRFLGLKAQDLLRIKNFLGV